MEIRKLVRSHSAADLPSGEAKLSAPPTGTAASDNEEEEGNQQTGAIETYHGKLNDEHTATNADYHQKQIDMQATKTDDYQHKPQQGEVKREVESPEWTDPALDAMWTTPPELHAEGEESEAGKSPKWDDPAHDAPWTTPKDLIMEEDREVVPPGDSMPVDMVTIYTPVEEAFTAVFHGMNIQRLQKEWNLPVDEEDDAGATESNRSEKAGETSQAGDDDLVKKVLQKLRGDNDEEEIEVETHQTGDPAAELAGARRGGDIKAKQGRVLKVGHLNVRLPVPNSSTTSGEHVEMPRGSLAAKILRWARQAGGKQSQQCRAGGAHGSFPRVHHVLKRLRTSLHLSAVAEADLRGHSQS